MSKPNWSALANVHYDFDFKRVVERKDQVIEALRSGVETLLSQPGITLVKEEAAFIDAKTVQTTSGETFTAPNIIIATGAEYCLNVLYDLTEDEKYQREIEFMRDHEEN